MRPNWIYCCLLSLLISVSTSAQKAKIKFNSINTGGIAIGESSAYGLFQTVNGVMYKKWFAGLGTGYDYYAYKTIPLFFDLRRYAGKQNEIFVFANAGYNFPWKNKPGKEIGYFNSYHFTGGFYSDIGVGYKIKFSKNNSVLFTTGYSYKKIRNKIGVTNFCLIPPCPEDFSYYDYSYGRILLKAGIDLK